MGLGGTFDHFHAGHEKFILFAASLADKLIIGITEDKFTRDKPFPHLIEPFQHRLKAVSRFCKHHRIQAEYTELNDIYGPTLSDDRIDALAVTEETVGGARAINTLRAKLGLPDLPTHVCSMHLTTAGKPLHAESIRAGLCNREGEEYLQLFESDFVFTEQQRHYFSAAQGELVTQPLHKNLNDLVVVVGDRSLNSFRKQRWSYDIGLFDGQEQRQPTPMPSLPHKSVTSTVSNPPGTISVGLVTALLKAIERKSGHIKVEGEEDLAAVALFLLAPLGSKIYYGQPNAGLVAVTLTEEFKEKIAGVLHQKTA